MGKASRDKGTRRELEFAKLVGGRRVPLSGAAGGDFSDDVLLPNGWRAEVKARRDAWRTLYAMLGKADLLALKADRKDWLVVLPIAQFQELLMPLLHLLADDDGNLGDGQLMRELGEVRHANGVDHEAD